MTELEKATQVYCQEHDDDCFDAIAEGCPYIREAFKAGAECQYEQFEKNRLAACDNMTKEEADREQEFTTDFIEKNNRIPTYSDAIEYGRKLMIDKAIEWLENNLSQEVSVISGGYVHINFDNAIEEFKKAMED